MTIQQNTATKNTNAPSKVSKIDTTKFRMAESDSTETELSESEEEASVKSTESKNVVVSKAARPQEANATLASASLALTLYVAALTIIVWYILFMVPKAYLPEALSFVPTLDMAPKIETQSSVTLDLVLIALFGIFHSLFARKPVKEWMGFPKTFERSFFMAQSELCLVLLLANFRNFDAPMIWDVTSVSWLSGAIMTNFVLGALVLVTATFALDHFDLFGLSQGFGVDINKFIGLAPAKKNSIKKDASLEVVTRWHYTLVAHPIMTGFLMMLWSTPIMTVPRLLFSMGHTVYILGAVRHLEEPDLLADMGPAYAKYLKSVPKFIPFLA